MAEPQVSFSALTDPAFDYVALGHVHRHQDLNPNGQPHVVYCGSPDRIDFGEKDEPKGFVLVQLRKGGADYEYIRVSEGRALLDIVVDADCDEPTEKILAEIKRHSLRNSIVKLTYKIGQARIPLVQEREIREALAPAFMVVSISRRVERDVTTRSRLLTETKTPREALELYIDAQEKYRPHKDRLMEFAEPLFKELSEEDTGW
jgi:exonuclease SbcD